MRKKMRLDEEKALCRDKPSLVALAIKRGHPHPETWADWTLIGRALRAKRLAESSRHLKGRPI